MPLSRILFSGIPGKYVPLKDTIRGFQAIINGEADAYPEAAFFNVGTIDDVIAKLKGIECGRKGTSCPDQIAIALEKIKKGEI